MQLSLNPDLDRDSLAAAYEHRKRVQIHDFLDSETASRVHRDLESLPFGIAFNEGHQVHQLHADALARLDSGAAAQIMAGIRERARREYQFIYGFYPLLNAYFSEEAPSLGIFDFYELLNSPPVLEFIRTVTGLPDIRWADGQATWFKPGHFLKAHTDETPAEGRLAAYVMNFSRDWDMDWGGFLQFFDQAGNIEQAFKPTFNTLNIFTIPQMHSVSMVSTYVAAKRIAVTGWFRSDEPVRPIGQRP